MNTQARETETNKSAHDISGFSIFANGGAGEIHVMAHQMLDSGQVELGHRRLGDWLDTHQGSGSRWLHLHFHMGVFELAIGDWESAYARFLREVLPAAATTEDALTDAPALLWRIAVSAPDSMDLPWEPLRRTALRCLETSQDAFVTIHHLLALAGAGDSGSIEQWLRARRTHARATLSNSVEEVGRALHAYATGAYAKAARGLHRFAPYVSRIGGSRAQNELFRQIQNWCSLRGGNVEADTTQLIAA